MEEPPEASPSRVTAQRPRASARVNDPIASGVLGGVEPPVGRRDEPLRRAVPAAERRASDAHGALDPLVTEVRGRQEYCAAQALGGARGAVDGGAAEQDDELLPAVASEDVLDAQDLPHRGGE